MTDASTRVDSRAVLIGVSQYQDTGAFPPIQAAANSLNAMCALLADPTLCGWPPERVTMISNPTSRADLEGRLSDLAESTTGVLLVYYVGHGILTPRGELCLTVTSTRPDRPKITGLPWESVTEILHPSNCPARVRVAILDCCFAGQAISESLSAETGSQMADAAHVEGAYTLTATIRNRTAHVVPPDQQERARTSFTGELCDLVREGIPDGDAWLKLGDLYPVLRNRLRAKGLPIPNQRGTDTASRFLFTANKASSANRSADHHTTNPTAPRETTANAAEGPPSSTPLSSTPPQIPKPFDTSPTIPPAMPRLVQTPLATGQFTGSGPSPNVRRSRQLAVTLRAHPRRAIGGVAALAIVVTLVTTVPSSNGGPPNPNNTSSTGPTRPSIATSTPASISTGFGALAAPHTIVMATCSIDTPSLSITLTGYDTRTLAQTAAYSKRIASPLVGGVSICQAPNQSDYTIASLVHNALTASTTSLSGLSTVASGCAYTCLTNPAGTIAAVRDANAGEPITVAAVTGGVVSGAAVDTYPSTSGYQAIAWLDDSSLLCVTSDNPPRLVRLVVAVPTGSGTAVASPTIAVLPLSVTLADDHVNAINDVALSADGKGLLIVGDTSGNTEIFYAATLNGTLSTPVPVPPSSGLAPLEATNEVAVIATWTP